MSFNISTPETPKPRQAKSILLIGPPGGGKTTLMLQFPMLGVVDCDENLDGPERFLRHVRKFPLSYKYASARRDEEDNVIGAEKSFQRTLVLLDQLKADPEILSVGVDSLTWINEFIIRRILTEQKDNRTEMEARDWIPFKSRFLLLLASKIRGIGKTTICTVHESVNWIPHPTQLTMKIVDSYDPSVQGSIVDYFGAFFTDVWRCEQTEGPTTSAGVPSQIFKVTTAPTTKSKYLKNSMGLPPVMKNVKWDDLKPYIYEQEKEAIRPA